mgnify:CR=1 FL=1
MVLATTHTALAIGIAFITAKYKKLKVRDYAILALGALVPDFDFLPALIFQNLEIHRMYLNFFWIPFAILLIGTLTFPKYKQEVLLFSIGYLSHIILDLIHLPLFTMALIDGIVITLITVMVLVKYWKK